MSAEQNEYDEPTGALDRSAFNKRVDEAMRAARPFAVCLLDLDRFKVINDSYGHEAGNAVLKAVATRLREALWADDAVGRFGGDEFTVLLAGADAERATRAAGKMRRVISQPMEVVGALVTPDISIGIALFPEHGSTGEALIRKADEEVQRLKRERRDSE